VPRVKNRHGLGGDAVYEPQMNMHDKSNGYA